MLTVSMGKAMYTCTDEVVKLGSSLKYFLVTFGTNSSCDVDSLLT